MTASYACSDGGSDVATCAAPVGSGANLDTTSLGTKSFTVTATDNVGNTTSQSVSYTVILTYQFTGFAQPVDNLDASGRPILNVVKAGQAIPLKWRLADASGAPVTTLTSAQLTVASLSCALGETTDELEEYAAGASGLQNLGNGYYQLNWKSPSTYAGSCKRLRLDLSEGSSVYHTADFQFTR